MLVLAWVTLSRHASCLFPAHGAVSFTPRASAIALTRVSRSTPNPDLHTSRQHLIVLASLIQTTPAGLLCRSDN